MKRAALLLILYTHPLDPGSALLCDLVQDQTAYYPGVIVEVANSCVPDRIFNNGFEGQ